MSKHAEQKPSSRVWADLNLLGVMLIWGTNIPIMKYAIGEMDKFMFNALRLALSTIVLALCVMWERGAVIDRSENAYPVNRQILLIVIFGIMTGFAYQVLFLFGIDNTSAGNTAVIMSAIPVWIAILAFLLLRENLSWYGWGGLTLAMIGTLVVTLSKNDTTIGGGSLKGNLLVSGAAFSWALGSVISRPMMKNISPIALAFWSMLIALPFHFLVATNSFHGFRAVFDNPMAVLALFYSGVFSTGLAYAMWNYGVKKIGPAQAGAFQNLVPLIALFTSWILLAEIPFALQLIGGALIILGLMVMRRKRAPIHLVEKATGES